ncbi:MAG: 30S ribosomal protein S4e [Candidatus Thorarchaeota archaeon]|nr:MAG: 30S ribosomal protein S4e [Candidatus Thorarchaeota archaeon]
MVRRGQKKHLKRLPAPRHWPIKRKHGKFITRPIPGPHPKENSLTLAIVLREILGYAENMREVKAILSSGQVTVDGRTRKDGRYPVGLMDVIEIENSGEKYRLLPKHRGGFLLVPIDEAEAKFKLCRIERKMMVSGGKLQITLHDGRNILLPEGHDASDYKTLDTLKITIPDQDVSESISLDTGVHALVTQGKNVGIQGRIVEIEKRYGTHASTVTIQDSEGNRLQTALDYVFVIGKDKPVVSLGPEGGSS